MMIPGLTEIARVECQQTRHSFGLHGSEQMRVVDSRTDTFQLTCDRRPQTVSDNRTRRHTLELEQCRSRLRA